VRPASALARGALRAPAPARGEVGPRNRDVGRRGSPIDRVPLPPPGRRLRGVRRRLLVRPRDPQVHPRRGVPGPHRRPLRPGLALPWLRDELRPRREFLLPARHRAPGVRRNAMGRRTRRPRGALPRGRSSRCARPMRRRTTHPPSDRSLPRRLCGPPCPRARGGSRFPFRTPRLNVRTCPERRPRCSHPSRR